MLRYDEDYRLLRDLVANNGQISISVDDIALKRRAEFLVEIGYATLDPITMTVVRLRVTHLGRIAKVLADFGICVQTSAQSSPSYLRQTVHGA